jgi:hypothetical protein
MDCGAGFSRGNEGKLETERYRKESSRSFRIKA